MTARNNIRVELVILRKGKTKNDKSYFSAIFDEGDTADDNIWVNVFYAPEAVMCKYIREGNSVMVMGILSVKKIEDNMFVTINAFEIKVKAYKIFDDVAEEKVDEILF